MKLALLSLLLIVPVYAVDLPNPAILTANNDYDITSMVPGKEYLITLEGTFGTAAVTITVWNDALQVWTAVSGGSFTSRAEPRILMPSQKIRFTVTGAGGTSIGVTVVPIKQ